MVKSKAAAFICQSCGASTSKWSGRCATCGEWNTLVEEVSPSTLSSAGKALSAQSIADISGKSDGDRLSTNFEELDRVLGGGLVAGSVTLLSGQPGIGKSTLLLQLAHQVAASGKPVLYVSGEESAAQIRLRADRLGATDKGIELAISTNADDVATTVMKNQYALVIVDSVQTLRVQGVTSAPGSVSQITNITHLVGSAAKQTSTAVILVGHVTKDGDVAGPKLLEHMVDVVMNFEGDRYGGLRVIRSAKNRYGSTNETALFEMVDKGLAEVANPSATLLAERQRSDGSVVLATMEGTRPLLVEVQALVTPSPFGYPKRTSVGFDVNRLNLMVAMLMRRTKLVLSDKDIYVNIVGGIRIADPAADLAVCMAIASAAKGMQLNQDAVVFGEVGLGGELRHVNAIDKRIAEAQKLGFKAIIGPKYKARKSEPYQEVSSVRDALNTYLERKGK